MKKKFFVIVFILCLVLSTCVFASNSSVVSNEILSDVYETKPNYLLEKSVVGNVFTITKSFEVLDNVSISGNIFVIANTVTLRSNVTYSEDKTSKDGNLSIDTINSRSIVKGNAYIICKDFIMESGTEISGDLFIIANNININKSASVGGNVFATTREFVLNGRIKKSLYAATNAFNMNYYGSITNDLHLSSEVANISSVINRNAYVDSIVFETTNDFLLVGDLNINASAVNFAGEIDGDANINTKKIDFIINPDNTSSKCLIKGNLNYSSNNELNIEEGIVKGEIAYSVYTEKTETNHSFSIKDFILRLVTFLIYNFVIVWLFTLFAKQYTKNKREINVKNTFITLGIGLLSILAIFVVTILLLLTNVGASLAGVLIVAYILILLLSIPLFVLDITNLLKEKMNFYLLTLLISLAIFLFSNIPFIGGFIMFLFTITGTGRIIKNLLFNKK